MRALKEIYIYREFFKNCVKKEIRGKYKASFLGVLWSFINPFLSVLIYIIVFPHIINPGMDNYLAYLICGIIPWNWISSAISYGTMTIIYNAGLIRKIYFPRIMLPLSVVTSTMIDFLISTIITIAIVLITGMGITWHIVFFPLITGILYLFILGIVLFTSALNVVIRDTVNIVNFIVSLLFYLTPILYPLRLFDGISSKIFNLNPFAHIINAYHNIFYYHTVPDILSLLNVTLIGIVVFTIGFKIFMKYEKTFAERL